MGSSPCLNGILFALYSVATVAVFLALLVSPALRAVSHAPLRDLLARPPVPGVVSVLYSSEKAEWLEQVVPLF